MITEHSYGLNKDGEKISLFKIKNSNKIEVHLINYGATITSIFTPDRENNFNDIVLGFNDISGYEKLDNPYFGATCGRYANRIKNGEFYIGDELFHLTKNDNDNSLHGGKKGFDKKIWDSFIREDSLSMKLVSEHGEEGYPGKLEVEVNFKLNDENNLIINYTATTNKKTVINLTNHSYFNLSGANNILDHIIQIYADTYVLVNDEAIPTGSLKNVLGTGMDLRKPTRIGKEIKSVQGLGYDHNYCLNKESNPISIAAEVFDPVSSRTLTCLTNEPGLQFYTGNFINNIKGKNGLVYNKNAGFCLETQHFPDSPNNYNFPSTILNPNETYSSLCIYKFGVKS